MSQNPDDTSFYSILVAIETDATRYYGPKAKRPGLLGLTDSETLLAHIATDLKSLLPDISNCSLITAGALFDQTQVLRPGYPLFGALESVSTGENAGNFKAGLVSIGAVDGSMPVDELQPLEDIPLGLLQLLPVVVHGPSDLVSDVGQAMEYRFMEEGQISAHSAGWLESAFGISINHARLMTLTDLNAMLQMQLEHFDFLPLWELLDAALTGRKDSLMVETPGGKAFEWKDGAVHTVYETFDYWATAGSGSQCIATRQALAEGYGAWTREVRQYLTTLRAHGLEVVFHLPDTKQPLEGSFFAEPSGTTQGGGDATITEHSYGELGTIAITSVDGDCIENYYPLCPQGLNDVHSYLREYLPGTQTVAFPGSILYDEKTRRLVPDSSTNSPPN
jgi:hypothetical protein